MEKISASRAKQNFGELLDACSHKPVAIERHNRVRAIMCSPELFDQRAPEADALIQRRIARAELGLAEKQRLIDHQSLAIRLLTASVEESHALIAAARKEVSRWRQGQLCSEDFCDRWDALLGQPVTALALAMGSGDLEWGPALRRNSPWAVIRA